jgi:hypothetical protein
MLLSESAAYIAQDLTSRSVTKIEMTAEIPNPSPLEKKKNIERPKLPKGTFAFAKKFKSGTQWRL